MPDLRCDACRFWDRRFTHSPDVGICRRLPPDFLSGHATWPLTQEDDWCGEHKLEGPDMIARLQYADDIPF